jgi:very-short-patch-repair endonuclease
MKVHEIKCTGKDNCSTGEYKIKQILNKNNIPYNFNSTNGLKGTKGWLRWDFIILNNDDSLFIEYDGAQHFEPQRFGGISAEKAQENFEKAQAHDKIKNDYCKSEGYLLLRIHYKDYDKIDERIIEFITDNTDYSSSSELSLL